MYIYIDIDCCNIILIYNTYDLRYLLYDAMSYDATYNL